MGKKKIDTNVRYYATVLLEEKGYISPIDLLIKMERITVKQVEDWRFKRIACLERVAVSNLSKLNRILEALKKFALENGLRPSETVYKSWGKGAKRTNKSIDSGESV